MLTPKDLEDALKLLPIDAPHVEVSGDSVSLVATVTSSSYQGVDEAKRQEAVWAHLREKIGERELQRVEFVFTNAPGEMTDDQT